MARFAAKAAAVVTALALLAGLGAQQAFAAGAADPAGSVLDGAPAISGTVTDPAAGWLAEVRVTAYDASSGRMAWPTQQTTASGGYAIPVVAGTYVVCFDARGASGGSSTTG